MSSATEHLVTAMESSFQVASVRFRAHQIASSSPENTDAQKAAQEIDVHLVAINQMVEKLKWNLRFNTLLHTYPELSQQNLERGADLLTAFAAESSEAWTQFKQDFKDRAWREMVGWDPSVRKAEKDKCWAEIEAPIWQRQQAILEESVLSKSSSATDHFSVKPIEENTSIAEEIDRRSKRCQFIFDSIKGQ